jgi:hypothetical protein
MPHGVTFVIAEGIGERARFLPGDVSIARRTARGLWLSSGDIRQEKPERKEQLCAPGRHHRTLPE